MKNGAAKDVLEVYKTAVYEQDVRNSYLSMPRTFTFMIVGATGNAEGSPSGERM